MPVKYFNDIDISIGGTGILAESASLSSENSIAPHFILGKRGIIDQSPEGPTKTTFSFNYLLEIDNEPGLTGINKLKTLSNPNSGENITISIAGITGYNCYLENYSIKIMPNDLLQVNSQYTSFVPTSGSVLSSDNSISYNTTNSLAHSWNTFLFDSGNFTTIYDFDYNFQTSFQPQYKIGQKTPSQVTLMSINETMNFTRDNFNHINFTGSGIENVFNTSDSKIDIYSISLLCSNTPSLFNIDISGGKVKQEELNVGLDDFVKIKTNIQKFY